MRDKTDSTASQEADITTTPLGTVAVDIISDLCERLTAVAADSAPAAGAERTYPVSAVCTALGVPAEEWPLFARWSTDFMDPTALDELYAHLDVMIAQRCAAPGEDLLSYLIGLETDGDGLTVDDLHTIVAVLIAGVEQG